MIPSSIHFVDFSENTDRGSEKKGTPSTTVVDFRKSNTHTKGERKATKTRRYFSLLFIDGASGARSPLKSIHHTERQRRSIGLLKFILGSNNTQFKRERGEMQQKYGDIHSSKLRRCEESPTQRSLKSTAFIEPIESSR